MDYNVAIDYGCDHGQAWVGEAAVKDYDLVWTPDQWGFSLFVVGATIKNWVDAKTIVKTKDCPPGQQGHVLNVTLDIQWWERYSIGFNPGIGPIPFDVGWSVGVDTLLMSRKETFDVNCCCDK